MCIDMHNISWNKIFHIMTELIIRMKITSSQLLFLVKILIIGGMKSTLLSPEKMSLSGY